MYIKGVTERFDFWRYENLANSKSICQKTKQRERPKGRLYIHCYIYICRCGKWLYIHSRRGAFDVARFDKLGNARAFVAWNGRQTGSTFFYVCTHERHQWFASKEPDWMTKEDHLWNIWCTRIRFTWKNVCILYSYTFCKHFRLYLWNNAFLCSMQLWFFCHLWQIRSSNQSSKISDYGNVSDYHETP